MADERVVKVFHAARQDVEIFWKLSGVLPTPMFDTQVAAMVCGYGDQVSYSELVQSVCRVAIDKSSRFTDWARRPLAEAQIDYAIGDVTHLARRLPGADQTARGDRPAVLARGRDEGADLAGDLRAASRARLGAIQEPRARKPRDLAVLMELAAWREREAQARDVPRSRVLKDDVLIELALAAPAQPSRRSANLRAFPRGMERSRAGGEILAAIERGLARDPKTLPKIERERRNGGECRRRRSNCSRCCLRQVSEESGVAGKMIATIDDLEAIAGDDKADVPALQGWRRKLFGERALELKHGGWR